VVSEDRGDAVSDKYILVGQTPVPIEGDARTPEGVVWLLEWGRWYEESGRDRSRIVKQEVVLGICWVSTVFLGLDHNFMPGGPPVLFESMAFWAHEGGEEMDRCSTWLQAETMHRRMVAEVARPGAVLSYVWRTLRESVKEARKDWVKSWRELRGGG
jgi:hypothetical protein